MSIETEVNSFLKFWSTRFDRTDLVRMVLDIFNNYDTPPQMMSGNVESSFLMELTSLNSNLEERASSRSMAA